MEDIRDYLVQEMTRRQTGHDQNKRMLDTRQAELDNMINLPVEQRQDITPYVSLVDSWTGSKLAPTVSKPSSVRDDIKTALQTRLQQPKESPVEMALALEGLRSKEEIARMRASRMGAGKPLSAEELKRLDNIQMSMQAVGDVESALNKGYTARPDALAGAIGDNQFSEANRRFAESIGRLQSGGAITDDEGKRFLALMPTWKDSSEIRKIKIANMKGELERRLEGIKTRGAYLNDPGYGQSSGAAGGVDLTGMSDAELQRIINGN